MKNFLCIMMSLVLLMLTASCAAPSNEGDVLECFKGDIPNTFTLFQDGCSRATMDGYPLCTSGNEFVVYLKELKEDIGLDYNSVNWIVGAHDTVFYISYHESGNRYYADGRGVLGETMRVPSNYAYNEDISGQVYCAYNANNVCRLCGTPTGSQPWSLRNETQ